MFLEFLGLRLSVYVSWSPRNQEINSFPSRMSRWKQSLVHHGGMGRSGVTASYFIYLHEASCHFVVCWLGWMHFVATVSFTFFYYFSAFLGFPLSVYVSWSPRNQESDSFPSRMSRWTRARWKQSLVHQGGNGGGVGSLLPTSLIFMRLHVIL